MARAPEPQLVPPTDPRLAVTAALVAGQHREVIGQATVLSSDIAVTTAEVIKEARARGPNSAGPFVLAFPEFEFSAEHLLPVEIQAVDEGDGFGVLSFSGVLPFPVRTGEIPEQGSECDILYYDHPQKGCSQFLGQVGEQSGLRFRLIVDRFPPAEIAGLLFSRTVGSLELSRMFDEMSPTRLNLVPVFACNALLKC